MKTLFISGDPAILDPGTASAVRMRAYADVLGSLSILIRIPKGQPTVRTDGPLTVYGVPGGKLDGARALADKAHALILSEGIEVVSAQDPFEHGWAAEKAIRGTQAKLHLQVHTDFLSPWFVRGGVLNSPQLPVPVLNRIRRRLADRLLQKAHGIRVVSERIQLSLQARYGTRIVLPVVIPLTPPTESGPPVRLPHSPFNFVFMTVSRLAPEKRIEDIILSYAALAYRYPTVGLMIVGEGSERASLEALVKEQKLQDHVQFLGARSDARGLLQNAQCFVQASAYEGYGMSLIEAALARVPIITTDVGIVGEVFMGMTDVLSTPPGDPAQLAIHMVNMIENNSARQVLAHNAERKAKAHMATHADLVGDVTRDLLRLSGGSSPA